MESKIMQLVAEVIGESDKELVYKEGVKLNEDYFLDSLGVVELISRIEDEFGFEFDLDEFNVDLIYDLDTIIETVKQNA